MRRCTAVTLLACAALVAGVPTPTQPPRLGERDIAASITAYIATAIPSNIAAGVLSLPSAPGVLNQFSISSSAVAAQPTHFLDLKGYANWSSTSSQWTGRVHGLLYKVRRADRSGPDLRRYRPSRLTRPTSRLTCSCRTRMSPSCRRRASLSSISHL